MPSTSKHARIYNDALDCTVPFVIQRCCMLRFTLFKSISENWRSALPPAFHSNTICLGPDVFRNHCSPAEGLGTHTRYSEVKRKGKERAVQYFCLLSIRSGSLQHPMCNLSLQAPPSLPTPPLCLHCLKASLARLSCLPCSISYDDRVPPLPLSLIQQRALQK